jgi:hypothetical protein
VRLVRNPANRGFAGGANDGLRAARGEALVVLNQDVACEPGFLEHLLQAARGRAGMVAPKMVFFDEPGRINSTGLQLRAPFRAEDRGWGERDRGQWDEPGEVFGPSGGAALYTRAFLEDVGLFDEDLFCYYEDVDLAWRGRLAGWSCAYAPRAVVRHKVRGGLRGGRVPPQVVRWSERNRLWVLAKDAGPGTLARLAPALLRDEAELVAWARAGDPGPLRAQAEALRGLAGALRKRRSVKRRVPEAALRAWLLPPAGEVRGRPRSAPAPP